MITEYYIYDGEHHHWIKWNTENGWVGSELWASGASQFRGLGVLGGVRWELEKNIQISLRGIISLSFLRSHFCKVFLVCAWCQQPLVMSFFMFVPQSFNPHLSVVKVAAAFERLSWNDNIWLWVHLVCCLYCHCRFGCLSLDLTTIQRCVNMHYVTEAKWPFCITPCRLNDCCLTWPHAGQMAQLLHIR